MYRDYDFGDLEDEDDEINIKIKGRKENRRAAIKTLRDLAPVTGEIKVPHDLHGFIIGRKGSGIRSTMKQYDVNIIMPSKEKHSDVITIKGTTSAKVEQTKAALRRKIEQIERETKERLLRSFKLTVDVDPRHYPKIIGRGGVIVKKIRQDFNVKINFPERHERTITIIGYEKDAKDARYAILKLVQKEESMYKEKVKIDPTFYSRIIGSRGCNISQIRDRFKVDITFPRPSDPEPDLVLIQGDEENVLDAKEYLINFEEECLQDIQHRDMMRQYSRNGTHEKDGNSTRDQTKYGEALGTSDEQGVHDLRS